MLGSIWALIPAGLMAMLIIVRTALVSPLDEQDRSLDMRVKTIIKLSLVLLPMLAITPAAAQKDRDEGATLRVLSFNILQGGGDASNVGFPNRDFGGSRYDELAAKETIVLTGDFNEPSHLDWTARAARDGVDRWVQNPTGIPLQQAFANQLDRWLTAAKG